MKPSGLLCLVMFSALAAFGQPAQVILLRHAEKPEDEAALHLSPQGARRAQALAEFLGKPNAMTSNAPIAALYATRVTRHSHSQRTGETLAPLAKQLGLPVQMPYTAELYSLLAHDILRNRAYQGRTVVICWTHHDIADLAAALGVRPRPSKWKDNVFDRFWVVRFENGTATLRDLPQGLLSGDANSSLFPPRTCSGVRLPLSAPCGHSQTKPRGWAQLIHCTSNLWRPHPSPRPSPR